VGGTDILHDVSHTFLVFVWIPQYTMNSVPKLILGLAGEWVPSIISCQVSRAGCEPHMKWVWLWYQLWL